MWPMADTMCEPHFRPTLLLKLPESFLHLGSYFIPRLEH